MAREGNIELSITQIDNLYNLIEQFEPKNADFMFECSRLFSRISGCHSKIIKNTFLLVQKCRKLNPLASEYTIEMANQNVMLKNYSAAFALYQEAASLDEVPIKNVIYL